MDCKVLWDHLAPLGLQDLQAPLDHRVFRAYFLMALEICSVRQYVLLVHPALQACPALRDTLVTRENRAKSEKMVKRVILALRDLLGFQEASDYRAQEG